MAEKELGYVELEWTCPSCNTRNPGSTPKCQQCGTAMPENVKFEQSAEEKLITEQEKLAAAKAAPDVYCAYCGTRNSSAARVCKQCGAALAEGKAREKQGIIGGLRDKPAPPQKCPSCGTDNPAQALKCSNCGSSLAKAVVAVTPPAPATKPKGMGILPFILIAVFAVIAFFIFASSRTSNATGTVIDTRWRRVIAVESLAPVTREGWREQLPAGVEVLGCRQEVFEIVDQPAAGAREVCGTAYVVDTGTGYGQVKQDCKYEMLEDFCQYRTLAWVAGPPIVLEGRDLNPRWPETRLDQDQRAGSRSQEYVIVFRANDREYTYSTSNEDEYRRIAGGTRWQLTVNGLGHITQVSAP
jgi:ribosomal protein L40E